MFSTLNISYIFSCHFSISILRNKEQFVLIKIDDVKYLISVTETRHLVSNFVT